MYYLGDQKASSSQNYFVQYNKYSPWFATHHSHDTNCSLKNATADFFLSPLSQHDQQKLFFSSFGPFNGEILTCVMQDWRDE